MRDKFEQIVHDFIQRLKTSPEMIARAERLKRDLLGHPGRRRAGEFGVGPGAECGGAVS